MTGTQWQPTRTDPLLILAMDHRASFGTSLFDVHETPTDSQVAQMRAAKSLVFRALTEAQPDLPLGRPGVLVDEDYGPAVIAAAGADPGVVLAVPIEASGHDWFVPEFGDDWLAHLRAARPDYAKVLVRDNPDFAAEDRRSQLEHLASISAGLDAAGIPLIYELLVPATDAQRAAAGGDTDRYDRDLRPALVVQVIADNQAAGVHPTLWKVEGLETSDAARAVATVARSGDRPADLIVLGRDAPAERLEHWLDVALTVDGFVGFAIGRSIWEDAIRDWHAGTLDDDAAVEQITANYLRFARRWRP